MSKIIQISDVTKSYGKKLALDNISLNIESGCCFGLLGPNGAGKSTLMKTITGITDYDKGYIKIQNLDINTSKTEISSITGYVPQEITLYEKISAYNNLLFFGELYGIKGAKLRNRISEVLSQVGLSDRAQDAVSTFSGGMKRRINIAAALLHKPKLLILDEPTVGVDPQSRNHIFNIIKDLKAEGTSIIYSTHYMEEVEALCDDIAIIDNGTIIANGPLDKIVSEHGKDAVYVESDAFISSPYLHQYKNVYSKGKGWVIESENILKTIQDITSMAINNNISIRELSIMRPSLETIFLSLTGTSLRD